MAARPVSDHVARPAEWWWIFDPRYSLRARAALVVGGGLLGLSFALTALAGTVLRRTLESHLGGYFETLAFQVSDKLDRTVYERQRALLLAATLPGLRDPATPPAERRRLLETLQETNPDFAWIGFADTSGHVTAGTWGLQESMDVSGRGWFVAAHERPFYGGLMERPELAREIPDAATNDIGRRFLDLAVPVHDPTGRFIGVLGAHVRWQWAQDVQRSVVPDPGRNEHTYVTVYGPNREVLLDSAAGFWAQPPFPAKEIDPTRQRGTLVEETSNGSRYVTAYARSRGFRDYRGVGWLTLVRQPVERAFAPVEQLQRAISLRGTALAVAGMVAAWLVTGRLVRRMTSVTAAAQRIREGDVLTVLPEPAGSSEMDRMCGALGDLVEDLRAGKKPASSGAPAEEPSAR